MNRYANTEKDIHQRIHKFTVNCFINIVRKIPKFPENIGVIQQVSASLTSVGANDQEADAADSNKDFIAKYKIVKKEAKETRYWLTFIRDTEILPAAIVEPFIQESREILLIVSKIILNASL